MSSDWIEAEGGTVEEAIESALGSLGAERTDVSVEILAEPSRGLFGLGGRRARVRVARGRTAPPMAPARGGAEGAKDSAPLSAATLEPARATLAELLRRMGFTSEVGIDGEGDSLTLQITGDNTSLLIGKHGQTLDALEYTLNRIISREDEAAARIQVDCEQYRVKRRRSLEDLAHRMAEQARRRRRSVTLNPMTPRDRRIIHLALQGADGLTTRSSGDGYFRRLTIIPDGERRPSRPRSR